MYIQRVQTHISLYNLVIIVSTVIKVTIVITEWVKDQNFENPELRKFKFSNLQYAC